MGKKIAFNKLFNLFIILGALLVYVACIMFKDDGLGREIGIGIVLLVIALFFIVVSVAFMPYLYVFDEQGVSICYIFLPNERYLWKNIHHIEATDDSVGSSHHSAIFDLLFSRVFQIDGNVEGKCCFYMNGTIRRSIRTKYLLESYWDGEITGYFFEGVKEWTKERKSKNQSRTIETDEIAMKEREARKCAKSWIEPFLADAKQLDLEIDTKFIYITKDSAQLNSRPKKAYTYVALVKISQCGNEDNGKIVEVSVDLLFARVGKKAFVGVINKTAQEELNFYLEDTLKVISQKGIEAYCNK